MATVHTGLSTGPWWRPRSGAENHPIRPSGVHEHRKRRLAMSTEDPLKRRPQLPTAAAVVAAAAIASTLLAIGLIATEQPAAASTLKLNAVAGPSTSATNPDSGVSK